MISIMKDANDENFLYMVIKIKHISIDIFKDFS